MQDLERSRNTRHRPAVEVLAGVAMMMALATGTVVLLRWWLGG